jgi:zinc D-Ala-D-Ala carboxypeptidase
MFRLSLLLLGLALLFGAIFLKGLSPSYQPDELADWGEDANVLGENTGTCPELSFLDLLLDKDTGLPADYLPADLVSLGNFKLRSEAANELTTMLEEMQRSRLSAAIASAFRTPSDQAQLYNLSRGKNGTLTAAPPGHSEHQLGTAVDLTIKYPSREWTWLDQNAHRFGFVMSYRYPQITQTGYRFEPWHWRYVGIQLATKIRYSASTPQSFYRKISCN